MIAALILAIRTGNPPVIPPDPDPEFLAVDVDNNIVVNTDGTILTPSA